MAREVLDHGVVLPAEYSDDWYEDMTSNLQKLDNVIGSDGDKLSAGDVATVAISGDYDDLTNKPELKPVATSGDYDDLTDKPGYGILRMTSETLSDSGSGAISNLNSDSKLAAGDYVLDAALKVFPIIAVSAPNYTVGTSLFQITNASALAAVATSGSYDDLNNLPTYGITRFVNAAITDNSNVAFANISSVDKIKAGDFLLDNAGKMYLIASVDTVNETAAVTTPLTVLALDANVMHLSGNETVGGIKTFSDYPIFTTFDGIRFRCAHNPNAYITFRNATQANPGSIILTANDGSISTTVFLVDKSFIPYNNADVDLGTLSRAWKSVSGNLYNSIGTYIGNEVSANQRTNILLMANRDTSDKSGAYITRFRQNRSQGALQPTDFQMIGFDVLENEVRTSNVFNIRCTDWLNDVPQKVYLVSYGQSYSYGSSSNKALINDLNPGSLSFPDLNNGLDISGYISSGSGHNEYTPLVDGWISVILKSTSGAIALFLHQGDFVNGFYGSTSLPNETEPCAMAMLPVKAGSLVNIDTKGTNSYVYSAKFYPCLGNV